MLFVVCHFWFLSCAVELILLFLLQEYLARLEAIRRQNFLERQEIQKRMAAVRVPVDVPRGQVSQLHLLCDYHYLDLLLSACVQCEFFCCCYYRKRT